jgi:hypothetical protein
MAHGAAMTIVATAITANIRMMRFTVALDHKKSIRNQDGPKPVLWSYSLDQA